jgi:hypothetical protein
MISGIILILLSLIAVPSLILSKHEKAGELLSKIAPYQGWIGLVFCFWGLWVIINSLLNLNWISYYPIWWATYLASGIVQFTLGFLLGYGMINELVLSKNEQAKEKGEQLLAKLAPLQGKIGLFGVALGVWTIVASLLFYV